MHRRWIERALRHRWLWLAGIVAAVAVASLIVVALRARPNGCIFDDGAAFCGMASGKLAPLPWARRVLVPAIVSWLPGGWSLVFRFKLVALVSSAGAIAASGLLAFRLLRDRAPLRVAYPAAVLAAALVALSPHLIRLALTTPVLVDQAAIFLGLVWCLLITARGASLRALSPLVALVLVPSREAWMLPLVLAVGVLWWMRERRLAAATLAATIAGAVFTFTRPRATVGPFGRFSSIRQVLHDGRLAVIHPHHALWAIFFGAGFLGILAILLLARRQRLRFPTGLVLAVMCGHLVQAPLGGTDVSRYAAAALPFAVVLAIAATVEAGSDRAFDALLLLTAATIVLWQPFRVPAPGVSSYAAMYYPGPASAAIALGGLILIAATIAWVLRSGRGVIPGTAARAGP